MQITPSIPTDFLFLPEVRATSSVSFFLRPHNIVARLNTLHAILAFFERWGPTTMAHRNVQQMNMQSHPSPQAGRHGTNSPAAVEQKAPPHKEGPTPPPPSPPPAAGEGAGPGEGSGADPNALSLEMILDLKSFRKPWEKTFTQRCRLFVGNLPTDLSEEDFKKLFSKYGEANEVFINRDRGFGFIRLVCL